MKHKWHKEIKAWADGATIQFHIGEGLWKDCMDNDPAWIEDEDMEYRVKPQPKEPQYLYVYKQYGQNGLEIKLWDELTPAQLYLGKIKLEEEE